MRNPEEAVRTACAARGMDATKLRLLHHYSNAVILLPSENAVARVAIGRHDVAQIRRSQHVTRWLVDQHSFPATRPLPGVDLVEVDAASTVSFWVYYPQPELPQPLTSAHVGRLLAGLHAIPPPPRDLPRWVPLDSLEHALQDDTAAILLTDTDTDRDWLHRRVGEIRDTLTTLDWPLGHGLIHGDAWVGNLLSSPTTHSPGGVVLGDWDRVAHGPREVDLIPTWHAARRYGKGPGWTRDFIHRYSHDITHWSGFPVLLAMRDLAQISGPLRRAAPFTTPRSRAAPTSRRTPAGDTTTVWTAL